MTHQLHQQRSVAAAAVDFVVARSAVGAPDYTSVASGLVANRAAVGLAN